MSDSTCSVEDCPRPLKTRGWCGTHYERWRRNGDLELRNSRPLWDRFWEKVDASGDCWEWTAATNDSGYGQIGRGPGTRQILYAHRTAWELLVGEIPADMTIDHLCRNPRCVNPDHLEPVPEATNIRRGARAKLNLEKARSVRRLHATGRYTQAALGARFGVDASVITRILNHERWAEPGELE